MIPLDNSFGQIQSAFRDIEGKLLRLLNGNIDLRKRRITNAGVAVSDFDYVTQYELTKAIDGIKIPKIPSIFTSLTVATTTGFPKTITNNNGMFVYDSNGTAVHGMSLKALDG